MPLRHESIAGIRAQIDATLHDIRYGLRGLSKTPGFTLAAVLALALGIGANAAIFSVVNTVLLKPLAYRDPQQLVMVGPQGTMTVAPANFLDWQAQNHVFSAMGAADSWSPNFSGGDQPEHLLGLLTSIDLLPMFGVQPLHGRLFLPEEEQVGRDHEVVLSYKLWQRRFGGDPNIVGRSVALNGEPYTVVGVMPQGFQFATLWANKTEIWAPLAWGKRASSRESESLRVFARLRPGVTLDQARAEIANITTRLERQYPGTNRDVRVVSLIEAVVGDIRPALLVLLVAVGFVLLIACANVAHMLLARSAARQKEIAVRAALGARRGRLIRQLLTESIMLGLMGGILGLGLALAGVRALVALSPPEIPRLDSLAVDARVLLFLLLISVLTGIAFGLTPALRMSATALGESLKEAGRGSGESIRRNRFRSLLVASEFGLALVLLAGAGLMIRSFLAIVAIEPGFNQHKLLTMVVSVAGTREADPIQRGAFYRETLERVRALPGVPAAAEVNHLPIAGDDWKFPYWIEGRPLPPPGEGIHALYRVASSGFFGTMGIALRGRDFAETDTREAPAVVIVNERLAQLRWPGEDAIGKHLSLDSPRDGKPVWATVVGVCGNARQTDWIRPADEEFYFPLAQTKLLLESTGTYASYVTLVVRTTGDPAAMASAVAGAVHSIDKNIPLSEVQTMEQVVDEAQAQPRFYLLLLTAFAAVALVLAAVGIYGVMSYSVARRTREIGIRVALGASRGNVFKLVIGHGMLMALAGVVAGLIAAVGLTRLMSRLLYGVAPTDPLTFLLVSLTLGAVALLASYLPARRAVRVEPMTALRYE